ncbi:MAG TPA: hypothetical protein VHB21_07590 [Minicystis sp.]|nr:hypothetical protein [Minicystis sp.]
MIATIAAVVAACAAALLVVRAVSFGYPKPAFAAKNLARKEQAIVAAVADAMFPKGGPIPLSGTEAGLVGYMDAYVGRMPNPSRLLCRLLLRLLEHGPWLFGPRRTRFTRLSQRERLAALDDMRTSSIYFRRVAFLSMRTMLTMGYLANGDVARSMRMPLAPLAGEEAFA